MIRARTDGPHAEIARALRSVTAVIDVHGFGKLGCDLIARHVATHCPVFVEVKDGRKKPSARKLTPNELAMQAVYPLHYAVVLNVDDALRAVGALR